MLKKRDRERPGPKAKAQTYATPYVGEERQMLGTPPLVWKKRKALWGGTSAGTNYLVEITKNLKVTRGDVEIPNNVPIRGKERSRQTSQNKKDTAPFIQPKYKKKKIKLERGKGVNEKYDYRKQKV